MKNTLAVILSVSLGFNSLALSQERTTATPGSEYANPTNTEVAVTATPSTTLPQTIQTVSQQSAANNGKGNMLGMAAIGVTAIGVATNCFPPKPSCKWWAAGLAASVVVTAAMGKAKKQSDATVSAVTVGPSGNAADGGISTSDPAGYTGSGINYTENPDYQAGLKAIENLEKQGYSVNMTTGVVTDPQGNKFSADTFSSNSKMAAAGYSSGQIAGFNAEKAKLMKAIEAKTKSADGTDMYGEDIGGGGGAKAAASVGAADGGLGGISTASVAGALANQGLGIDRDPAQVAGMTKSLGGEPIGVSADSLFGMIQRRYDFLEVNGAFQAGP